MKIGIIIPDRGDRPELLQNCFRMMRKQTIFDQVDWMLPVSFKPVSDAVDITPRYRVGYYTLESFGVDVIFFIENDDWYAPEYLEVMCRAWEEQGRPNLFGINYAIHYHLGLLRYFTFDGQQMANAFNTMIKPGIRIPNMWPADDDPFTDQWLWSIIPGRKVFTPPRVISVGIKHGTTMSGGYGHVNKLHRFIHEDNGFLAKTLDPESLHFYEDFRIRFM